MVIERTNLYFLLCTAINVLSCSGKSNSITFSKITTDYKLVEISKDVNDSILSSYMDSNASNEFRKLAFTQSNGDNLIVEQKDENGYLILLNLRYEQFVIESQPSNLSEVSDIMHQYLKEKDGIMTKTKFY